MKQIKYQIIYFLTSISLISILSLLALVNSTHERRKRAWIVACACGARVSSSRRVVYSSSNTSIYSQKSSIFSRRCSNLYAWRFSINSLQSSTKKSGHVRVSYDSHSNTCQRSSTLFSVLFLCGSIIIEEKYEKMTNNYILS